MLLDQRSDDDLFLMDAADKSTVSVGDIRDAARRLKPYERGLAFLFAERNLQGVTHLLALLEGGVPVVLLDPDTSRESFDDLVRIYEPDVVLGGAAGWQENITTASSELNLPATHPGLSVLLTTSGTTGSPKLVRLSSDSIRANARQIAEALGLGASDRGVTSMPIHYSFGLSVVTSHAISGGVVVVSDASVVEERFWAELTQHHVTVLGGVPTTYAMLRRLGFDQKPLPRLRSLLQAGGRLDPESVTWFSQEMARRGGSLFVMYGQTEASPRMTTLPGDRTLEKLGSVGPALAGARLSIVNSQGAEVAPGEVGHVRFEGPNVMWGYAQTRQDLALGDTCGGRLDTGDLGYLDPDGYLYLVGRTARLCKLAGARVSLDETEALVGRLAPAGSSVAVWSPHDDLIVAVVTGAEDDEAGLLRKQVSRQLRVPPAMVRIDTVESLPVKTNGKVDYQAFTVEAH